MASLISHNAPRVVRANRRVDVRVRATDLGWLQGARVAGGPRVSLIDLSLRGALFEIGHRVRPGEATALELVADDERAVSSSVIVRSEIADVRPDGVRYRSACVFASPLPWTERFGAPPVTRDLVLPAGPAYEPRAGWSACTVLLRHARRRLDGFTHNFRSSCATIDVWPSRAAVAHEKQSVPLTLARAIVFERDFGDTDVPLPAAAAVGGCAAEVAFRNGQVVRGTIVALDLTGPGFWVLPSPPRTKRVFAVSAAVAEIRLYAE